MLDNGLDPNQYIKRNMTMWQINKVKDWSEELMFSDDYNEAIVMVMETQP